MRRKLLQTAVQPVEVPDGGPQYLRAAGLLPVGPAAVGKRHHVVTMIVHAPSATSPFDRSLHISAVDECSFESIIARDPAASPGRAGIYAERCPRPVGCVLADVGGSGRLILETFSQIPQGLLEQVELPERNPPSSRVAAGGLVSGLSPILYLNIIVVSVSYVFSEHVTYPVICPEEFFIIILYFCGHLSKTDGKIGARTFA